MKWRVLAALLGANMLYLVIGGVMLHFLEKDREDETRQNTRHELKSFLRRYDCLERDELERLIKVIIYAYNDGVIASNNASSATNWDMFSSIFFSGTVVTTIGYGHISPSTQAGRALCVVYALLGIPLMLVMLGGLGEKILLVPAHLTRKIKYFHKQPKRSRVALVCSTVLIGLIFFLLIPAAIFTAVEEWTYGEGFYYAFISLSTIGFGDYVAGQNLDDDTPARGLYRLSVSIWLLLGLAWLASIISAIQQLFSTVIGKMENKMNRPKRPPTKYELELEAERAGESKAEETKAVLTKFTEHKDTPDVNTNNHNAQVSPSAPVL